MRNLLLLSCMIVVTASTAVSQTANAVCPDPTKPCHHRQKKFDSWELTFRMPAKLVDNKTYSSAKFYAVIVKTYGLDADCGDNDYLEAAERDRKELQKKYPTQKVFGSYMCPNLSGVGYEFAGKWDKTHDSVLIDNFIAVYAGTKAEAERIQGELKAQFPDAMVKQMTASYERLSF